MLKTTKSRCFTFHITYEKYDIFDELPQGEECFDYSMKEGNKIKY